MKIPIQCSLRHDSPDIWKCKSRSTADFKSTIRHSLQTVSIHLCQCGGHHAEIQTIHHCISVSGLIFWVSYLLLDFLKSRFNFPALTIIFNNLLNGAVPYPWSWKQHESNMKSCINENIRFSNCFASCSLWYVVFIEAFPHWFYWVFCEIQYIMKRKTFNVSMLTFYVVILFSSSGGGQQKLITSPNGTIEE